MNTISFKHSGDIGDIVASLATVKEICERDEAKAEIHLDITGGVGDEFVPLQSRNGHTKFNENSAKFLKPLIEAQPYVSSVVLDKPPISADVNLNMFRRSFIDRDIISKTNQNLMYLHQITFNLEIGYKGPWIFSEKNSKRHKLLICRTPRYQSAHIICDILANDKNAEFMGTDFEWELWKQTFGQYPQGGRVEIKDLLDASSHIASSDTFFSNGTCFYWVAVGLGHRNIYHELGCDIPTTYFQNQNPKITYFIGGRRVK
jgi:hypothetical protein